MILSYYVKVTGWLFCLAADKEIRRLNVSVTLAQEIVSNTSPAAIDLVTEIQFFFVQFIKYKTSLSIQVLSAPHMAERVLPSKIYDLRKNVNIVLLTLFSHWYSLPTKYTLCPFSPFKCRKNRKFHQNHVLKCNNFYALSVICV